MAWFKAKCEVREGDVVKEGLALHPLGYRGVDGGCRGCEEETWVELIAGEVVED